MLENSIGAVACLADLQLIDGGRGGPRVAYQHKDEPRLVVDSEWYCASCGCNDHTLLCGDKHWNERSGGGLAANLLYRIEGGAAQVGWQQLGIDR